MATTAAGAPEGNAACATATAVAYRSAPASRTNPEVAAAEAPCEATTVTSPASSPSTETTRTPWLPSTRAERIPRRPTIAPENYDLRTVTKPPEISSHQETITRSPGNRPETTPCGGPGSALDSAAVLVAIIGT